MMMVFSVAIFAATETTVYYTASSEVIGKYTLKLNINRQGDADNWATYVMTKTDLSYNGDPVYTYTYTDLYDGVGAMQFQLYDGDTWKSQDQPISTWTSASTYNGKMYVHATGKWEDAPSGAVPTVTLYFVNAEDWDGVMTFVYDDNKNEYKPYPGEEMVKTDKKLKGKDVYSYTFPENYTKIGFVSKDGKKSTGNYAWSMILPYYYEDGDGYAGNNWYKEEDLVDKMTVYFFNNLEWTTVKAFVWEDAAYKTWPGEAAKKEAAQIYNTDVYAYTFPASYFNVIFNNGAESPIQTADLKWDADKPYFVPGDKNSEGKYEGKWYAKADIPAPEVPAKYYVTGDTALVVAAGVDKMKAWQPNAIKSEADTLELNLAAGDYVLKLTLDGTWAEGKARGYSNLTAPAAEGLSADKDDNICFKLTEAGIVKVIYFVAEEKETFKLEGKFYVKPVVKKELNLVPGVWANEKAQIAAWIWGAELEGQWTAFFVGKDTLKAEINAAADSIVFVRFNDQVAAPTWENEATNVWNKMAGDTIDYAGLTYTITDWAKGQWTVYVPEVPAKYYVTGDTALVVAAGVDKMKAWQPNAIKSE